MRKTKVVCFGGGTGLPNLLSGLAQNPFLDITALVSMFDDGGSSRILHDRYGILPPGDILKCFLALSRYGPMARQMLLERLADNHTGGNILLLGLEKVYGDYLSAINALGKLLAIQGMVLPISLEPSTICAEYETGPPVPVRGERMVDETMQRGHRISRLYLEPAVPALPQALDAIASADVICIGPGSFYTSILPNFSPTGVREAIAKSRARVIFVGNLVTEGSGMTGMGIEHMVGIVEQAIGTRINVTIRNVNGPGKSTSERYAREGKHPLQNADHRTIYDSRHYVSAQLWTDPEIARHDPVQLAYVIFGVIARWSAGYA